jgi:hypothetical protein
LDTTLVFTKENTFSHFSATNRKDTWIHHIHIFIGFEHLFNFFFTYISILVLHFFSILVSLIFISSLSLICYLFSSILPVWFGLNNPNKIPSITWCSRRKTKRNGDENIKANLIQSFSRVKSFSKSYIFFLTSSIEMLNQRELNYSQQVSSFYIVLWNLVFFFVTIASYFSFFFCSDTWTNR